MYYSDESRIFFRSRSTDVETLLTGLPKLNTVDIANRFKNAFAYLSGVRKIHFIYKNDIINLFLLLSVYIYIYNTYAAQIKIMNSMASILRVIG
jgi:hypothetical protein